jgi:monofunctional biosynthetic peptidoglycan transglycosylase
LARTFNKKKFLFLLAVIIALVFVIDVGRYFIYPSVAALKKKNPGKTAFMAYKEKAWKREGKSRKITQTWVPLSRVSPHLRKAVIIAEDGLFWSHEGFDFDAIEVALVKNIKQGKLKAGGSTITQQLAKNLYLSPSKTPVRKLKEAILAWRLERELSKGRLLEIYLNVAQWGDAIFGIEAASRYYYHKASSELTPDEAVRLAVVLPNPVRWSPVGGSRYVESRARTIYNIMVKRGMVPIEYAETEKDTGAEKTAPPIDALEVATQAQTPLGQPKPSETPLSPPQSPENPTLPGPARETPTARESKP